MDERPFKRGDLLRRKGQQGVATLDENALMIVVKVDGTTRTWPAEECTLVSRTDSSAD